MKRDKVYEMMKSEKWQKFNLSFRSLASDFVTGVIEETNRLLTDDEVEDILTYLKPHLYRYTVDYDGM